MRRVFVIAFASLLSQMPGAAYAQGLNTIEGFGGLSLNGVETRAPSVGGAVAVSITPGFQLVGEAGRLGNVLPTRAGTIFDVARTDVRVSAWYGEGGVRLIAPTGTVAPYAEATAGIARIDVSSARLGAIGNAAADIALGLAGRTSPIASVGGGILARGGPVVFDAGYRYKQLFASDVIKGVLGLGEPLRSHEVRAGIGVRF
jgi:hypothetical protein